MFEKYVVEKIKTLFFFAQLLVFEKHAVYEKKVEKFCGAGRAT